MGSQPLTLQKPLLFCLNWDISKEALYTDWRVESRRKEEAQKLGDEKKRGILKKQREQASLSKALFTGTVFEYRNEVSMSKRHLRSHVYCSTIYNN